MKKKLKYILINISEFMLHIFFIFPIKNNRIFFISHNGTQYSCNPKYIYEHLTKMSGLNLECIWCLNNFNLSDENTKIVKYKSLMFYYMILTSKVIISNDLISSNLPLRKKQKYIETWHGGGAYKKTGADVYQSKYEKLQVKKISNKMSYFISSSAHVSKTKSQGYFIDKNKILEIGMPRNDIFFRENNALKKVNKYFDIKENTKIILYAPTFRRNSSYNPLLELNIDQVISSFNHKFGNEWCLIYRLHRVLSNENIKINNAYDAIDYPNVQELLVAADVLITDFSSIMWDFSLQYKPIFCFVPDISNFRESDFFTPIEEWPGIVAYSNEMLQEKIMSFDKEKYINKVKEHHIKHVNFDKGIATETISKLILEYMNK